jgi:peptidoglycan/xylan/chitin deacetylase (PgdA/CDA1 family)
MIAKTIKNIIGKIPVIALNGKRFIFCYHDISTPQEPHFAGDHYSTEINAFKEQIEFFKSNCNLVSLEDIVLKETLPKNKVHIAITFDDGFYSVLKNAHPILKKERIPYSLFVNKEAILHNQLWVSNLIMKGNDKEYLERVYDNCLPSHIDKLDFFQSPLSFISKFEFDENSAKALRLPEEILPKTYLNLEEIKTLKEEGVSIGNHTNHHFILSSCSENLQKEEIESNQQFLKEAIGEVNPFFAIPFGKKEHFTDYTLSTIRKSDMAYALTTNVNPYNYQSQEKLIPRIVITKDSINQIRFNMIRTLFKKYDL